MRFSIYAARVALPALLLWLAPAKVSTSQGLRAIESMHVDRSIYAAAGSSTAQMRAADRQILDIVTARGRPGPTDAPYVPAGP